MRDRRFNSVELGREKVHRIKKVCGADTKRGFNHLELGAHLVLHD